MSAGSDGALQGGYTWLAIAGPDSYEELLEILDSEFGPESIAEVLKNSISSEVRGILIEHEYIDKDYRSTFYNFYAKMGRPYRQDCVRLHFFNKDVVLAESPLDLQLSAESEARGESIEQHYFGYMVLRPTIEATLGRSILAPRIRLGARGSAIQSLHNVHLLGLKLTVWGFPSMAQHEDIAVCAHVSCWAILRHYSAQFPQHRELLMHEITKMATPFDPGGLTPSLGLDIYESERIFRAAGGYPLTVVRKRSAHSGEWVDDDEFFAQMLSYLDSGFPLFVGLKSAVMENAGHAIVLAGYEWRNDPSTSGKGGSHAWSLVSGFLAVDDNMLPYRVVNIRADENSEPDVDNYFAEDFNAFIVPLPDKIFYPATAVEAYSRVTFCPIFGDLLDLPDQSTLVERYFITTVSGLRRFAREQVPQLGRLN